MFKKVSKHVRRLGGVVTGAVVLGSTQANAAISSVVPADLATDQATILGDIAAFGAVAIAIGLGVLAIKSGRRAMGS